MKSDLPIFEKMKQKTLIFILLSIAWNSRSMADVEVGWRFYWSPEISVGYTFGLGLSTGIVLDFGFVNVDQPGSIDRLALSISGQRVRDGRRDRVHRQRAVMATCMVDNFTGRIGYGRTKLGWGYNNNNACRVRGLRTDLSYTIQPSDFNYRIGLKSFYYTRRDWRWFDYPYETVYLSAAYPFDR